MNTTKIGIALALAAAVGGMTLAAGAWKSEQTPAVETVLGNQALLVDSVQVEPIAAFDLASGPNAGVRIDRFVDVLGSGFYGTGIGSQAFLDGEPAAGFELLPAGGMRVYVDARLSGTTEVRIVAPDGRAVVRSVEL